jgi:oxygen-dependent protoporphyrinogen oxidase
LSLKSTFPRFIALEQKHGSLIKGMLAQMKARKTQSNGATRPKLSLFMTLRGGLTELVDTLIDQLTGKLITGQSVTQIDYTPDGSTPYQLQLDNGQALTASRVIMATPAYTAANLLEPHSPSLAKKLRTIRYISTATVSLAFKREEIDHPLNGFGFVVPKSEPCQLMACTWVSTKFNHRAPDNRVLLRVFVGGYKREALVDLPDDELVSLVKRELANLMGITATPTRTEIYRWPHGNAQYDVEHLDRVADIEALAADNLPGLYFTGSAFRGVGIPDCIHQGQLTAEHVLKDVQKQTTQREYNDADEQITNPV